MSSEQFEDTTEECTTDLADDHESARGSQGRFGDRCGIGGGAVVGGEYSGGAAGRHKPALRRFDHHAEHSVNE
jgi:hypothetical protein